MNRSAALSAPPEEPACDRILGAAERAFARHGFHGASMQHVAAEAGMSAGNLYRYFQSKDAIVSGLTARDQAAMAGDFASLIHAPDFLAAIGAILHKHLVEEPAWRSRLILEIWAEAGRNPAIAAMCAGIEETVDTHLGALVAAVQARAPELAGGDPALVVRVMKTVVDGLFKRRASESRFEGEIEIAMALGIMRAALEGSIRPFAPRAEMVA